MESKQEGQPAQTGIVLLAYQRPAHLAAVLEGLRNEGATELMICIDAATSPKAKAAQKLIRKQLEHIQWATVTTHWHQQHLGLANAVRQTIQKHSNDTNVSFSSKMIASPVQGSLTLWKVHWMHTSLSQKSEASADIVTPSRPLPHKRMSSTPSKHVAFARGDGGPGKIDGQSIHKICQAFFSRPTTSSQHSHKISNETAKTKRSYKDKERSGASPGSYNIISPAHGQSRHHKHSSIILASMAVASINSTPRTFNSTHIPTTTLLLPSTFRLCQITTKDEKTPSMPT